MEFKKCGEGLPQSMWETYSSFANTFGGTIVLGIDERNGNIVSGVNDPDKILKDLWDTVNNPNRVNINLLQEDDVEIRTIQGRTIILVHVPRARRELRPVFLNNNLNSGTYRRNGQGDYHCTLNEIRRVGGKRGRWEVTGYR
ncbi:MAG: ATP-binding protein [archaeon]|nr:ATP-binding protein [archaeon]